MNRIFIFKKEALSKNIRNFFFILLLIFALASMPPGSFAQDSSKQSISETQDVQIEKEKSSDAPEFIQVTAVLKSTNKPVWEFRGNKKEHCVHCHKGIETISASHPSSFGCTVCHGGEAESLIKEEAHASLIFDPNSHTGKRNPSALSVVDKSCGLSGCHSGHEQEDKNHVDRVKKSLMGTLAGMISGLRFQWGAQADRKAHYAVQDVKDNSAKDGRVFPDRLFKLPYFSIKDVIESGLSQAQRVSRHPADHILRTRCFSCHLDSKPFKGEHRSQGCAACHVRYSKEARYSGKDPTIDKKETGHISKHKLHVLPSEETCLSCHRLFSFWKTTANPSFLSTIQQKPLQDVHIERGFACVDCHTQFDIMGDGNIYSKQHQAVEVSCKTCHGSKTVYPMVAKIESPEDPAVRLSAHYKGLDNKPGEWMVTTASGRKMSNVKMEKKRFITYSKSSGKKFVTPLIRNRKGHSIPEHRKKLECTACHSMWVPDCRGCHLDWNASSNNENKFKGQDWTIDSFSLKFKQPALMVGPRGRVMPMLSQPEHLLNVSDSEGKPTPVIDDKGDSKFNYRRFHFQNPEGFSGSNLAYATNPHSVGKKVRSCESCHLSSEALGLGAGDLILGKHRSGRNDRVLSIHRKAKITQQTNVEEDQKTTMRQEPIAGTHQIGARPFNQQEINRILKVGTCLPCHNSNQDKIYRNINRSYRFAKSEKHKKIMTTKLRPQ